MALGRKKQPMSQTALPRLVQIGIPIAYLRLSGENVTGHGNYYIENSESAGKSFFKKDSRKLTTVKPNSTTGNWEKADKQGSDSAYNETDWNKSSKKVKAHRLYIGYNVD